jgi:hypothetical protein
MTTAPRVVFGAPMYNAAAHVEAAIGSLLAQTEPALRVLLIDDASTDGTVDLALAIAAGDDRVGVHRNAARVGMLENTRQAWTQARAAWPEAPFWALASDHDVWAPTWLEELLDALYRHPRAVLAYPRARRIDGDGQAIPCTESRLCQTVGQGDQWRRLRHAYRCMTAGDMIYGLFRAAALERVGPYKPVLVPDRLLLSELALVGEFVQVPQVLWERRFVGLAELERQRSAFWPDGAPAYARRVPWWVMHAVAVGWTTDGTRRPAGTRLRLGCELLRAGARLRTLRRLQQGRRRLGAALERPTRAAFAVPAFRRTVERGSLPIPGETQAVLQRLLAEWRAGS